MGYTMGVFVFVLVALLGGCDTGRTDGVPGWVRDRAMELIDAEVPEGLAMIEAGEKIIELAAREVALYTATAPRTLHFFELYGGAGGTTRVMEEKGYTSRCFDRQTNHWTEDTTLLCGLLWAGLSVLAIVECGCFYMSPQCSTWLWICRFVSKRSLTHVRGDESRKDVAEANLTATML